MRNGPITPEKMLDALMHVVGDRPLGQLFFGDFCLMDTELRSDPSRRAIQEQAARRGMKLVLPTLAPIRSNAWPWHNERRLESFRLVLSNRPANAPLRRETAR